MREKIRHGGLVKCDVAGCPARFVSYSIVSMMRKQAHSIGWERVPAWQVSTEDKPTRKYDVCPMHAVTAAENKARRPEIMAAARAQAKAARAELRAEKKAADKARRATARLEKKEARQLERELASKGKR